MPTATETIERIAERDYEFGFVTDIEQDSIPVGLNEDIIRLISSKKDEPDYMLAWRLKSYAQWLKMKEPHWQNVTYADIDYQGLVYYSAPKSMEDGPKSLDEVDPELLETYAKLGIPLKEQEMLAGVAVDAVFDSVSVATTFRTKLAELGIIFCSFSEAAREHPELVQKYLGSVVPANDNFFAALNSAVFSDGSFVYIPKGVRCPMELSTYFSHQRPEHRPIRAHFDHCRRGQLRELSRGLHSSDARREPASRRCRRAHRAQRRDDQVRHRAELVPRRQERQKVVSTTS